MLYPHPKILKVMTKVYGRICIIVHQEEFEILDDDKGVVIRLQEPVIVTEVVIINILETLLCFPPQTLSALLHLLSSMSNYSILTLILLSLIKINLG